MGRAIQASNRGPEGGPFCGGDKRPPGKISRYEPRVTDPQTGRACSLRRARRRLGKQRNMCGGKLAGRLGDFVLRGQSKVLPLGKIAK